MTASALCSYAEPLPSDTVVSPDNARAEFPSTVSPVAEALFGAWGGGHSPAARARAVLASALLADGPRPELAADLALFGQFVGSWDLAVTTYAENGTPQEDSGEWHFAWALDGRAIVDVWISPARDYRTRRADAGDYGITVRFFDPTIGAWRSTWLGPVRRTVRPFVARPVGDEIVLTGSFEPGLETRWIFSQITRHGFHWRAVQSSDGWQTQLLRQEMRATRRTD
ncbi:MAG: hypothetical protein QM691_08755 [Opitutaceae bacterium]